MNNLFIPIIMLLIFMVYSCGDDPEPENLTLIDLQISADSDTLLVKGGDKKTLLVNGIYVKVENNTITNKGGIAITSYTVVNTDTVVKGIDGSTLDWYSSNNSVATVDNGELKSTIYGGLTEITAYKDLLISNTIYVMVQAGAPLLIIDPPVTEIVFQQEIGNVSGWVAGTDFTLKLNSNNIEFSDEGRFNESVSLDVGENTFDIIATNNDESAFSTTRIKKIINLSFDDITGNWKGETATRPFSFEISQNEIIPFRYDIHGTLTIDLSALGWSEVVEDIAVIGLINYDGTIDAQLSKEASEMSISGSLEGYFSTSGLATGSYTLSFELFGIPFSHTEEWTAEKQ